MLTATQIEVAQIINKVEGRELFVPAGGGARILKEISNRETEDLDYFSRNRDIVNTFAKRCEKKLKENGLSTTIELENEGFCRLAVTGSSGTTIVDFGSDYFTGIESSEFGPTLSVLELGANKILALAGRFRSFLALP